jgi:hypothetical protein
MSTNLDSKWAQIEKRLNLQSISRFIKHGGIINKIDSRSFVEREEEAYISLQNYIVNACGKQISDEVMDNITAYSSVREDMYFTLGMKAGAQIITQLTASLESNV